MRQIPVLLAVVESISDHETILDREANIIDLHVNLASRWLAEKTSRPQRERPSSAQNVLEIRQRETGVDDVFDNDDVPSGECRIEILVKSRTSPDGSKCSDA